MNDFVPTELTHAQQGGAVALNGAMKPFIGAYLQANGLDHLLKPEMVTRVSMALSAGAIVALHRLLDDGLANVEAPSSDQMDVHLANLIAESRELDPNQPDPEPWVHTFAGAAPAGYERPSVRIPNPADDLDDCKCEYLPRVFPKPGDPDPTPDKNVPMCGAVDPVGMQLLCTWPADFEHTIHVAGMSGGVIAGAWPA